MSACINEPMTNGNNVNCACAQLSSPQEKVLNIRYKTPFSPSTVPNWNQLPAAAVNAVTPQAFKNQVSIHFN